MTNNKDHTEEIIRKLVQKSDLESPSDGFTDNIMNVIQAEEQLEVVKPDPTFTTWQWILIIVPGLLLVGGAFYYYRQYFIGMLDSGYITGTVIPYLQALFGKGSEVLSKQEFSPILIIVLSSAGVLMIIDRFVNLGRRMKSYLLTF